ncbi:FxsA family protein [Neobacillus sp. NPDC097160]|uniref:FxsA family protein n=1 Tax=Neobacillus sp. NPDC097160 TaxID=3364298 RepID=UPI00382888A2
MRYLLILIIAIPAAEIGLLLLSGKTIGAWPTILLIILTGVIGAYLAKREGLQTIRKAQEQLRNGHIPGEAVLDGICILVGGIFLLLPGFITDISGFLMLFPPTRRVVKFLMINSIRKKIQRGNIKIIK